MIHGLLPTSLRFRFRYGRSALLRRACCKGQVQSESVYSRTVTVLSRLPNIRTGACGLTRLPLQSVCRGGVFPQAPIPLEGGSIKLLLFHCPSLSFPSIYAVGFFFAGFSFFSGTFCVSFCVVFWAARSLYRLNNIVITYALNFASTTFESLERTATKCSSAEITVVFASMSLSSSMSTSRFM